MSSSKSRGRSRTSMRSVQSGVSSVVNSPEDPSKFELNEHKQLPQSNREHHQQNETSNEFPKETTFVPWRIFVNHIDSYHGKKLVELLPGRKFTVDLQTEEHDARDDVNEVDHTAYEREGTRRKNKIPDIRGYEDDDNDDEPNENSDGEISFTGGKIGTMRRKLEVIGTVKDVKCKRPEDVTMVIRTTKNRELLLRELMKCGVVIYDITQDDSQIAEASWALEAIVEELLRSRRDAPKAYERSTEIRHFILISTLMTWALTKPLDLESSELPFTEMDYRKRKPHRNFKEHIKCERDVATIAKRNKISDKLKTVVLGTGVTYGDEEGPLHYLFKMAWQNADYLPIFGSGSNKIPLLHIRDLVEVIYMLMKKWPKSRYIVAVERELVSQATIVKKISKSLTTGKVEVITAEEAFLFDEMSQRIYDMTNANINIAPGYIVDNELEWYRDTPFRINVDAVVEEYKKARNLYPVKIIVHGPPASGKTILARRLVEHYGIHYLNIKNLIAETILKLSKEIEAAVAPDVRKEDSARVDFEEIEEEDEDDEDAPEVDNLREQLNEIRDNLTENNGRLNDDILNKLFLKRLLSKDCQNQGYVIDGYPKTLSQATSVFGSGDNDDEDMDETENDQSNVSMIGGNKKIMPELIIALEANDEFLIERVICLPEKEIQRTHYDEEGMLRRLREYRERNTDDETPLQFFDEREIHPLFITIEDDICPEMFDTFVRCIERLGEPRNYGPSDFEREDAKKREEAEALAASKLEAARKEREDFERKTAREKKMREWTDLSDKLREEEEEQLCVMVEPLRHYLVKYIFPTLTKGLVEVAKLRPEDPIDFLAEYLFRENPEGKMFEPDYTETMSMLLDAIGKLQENILPSAELDSGNERYLKSEGSKQVARAEKPCKSSTEEDEDDANERMRKSTMEFRDVESSSGMEAISASNDVTTYIRDSDAMMASSFSYEQIAEGSRKSFGNSTNLSLEDSH